MKDPIIKINEIRKVYRVGNEKVVALDDITLNIFKGEVCCFLGTSGSGKSTLLNLMAGLEKPTKGTIELKGEVITEMSEKRLAKLRQKYVGFIFQSYNLIPTLTAVENVSLPLTFRKVGKTEREREAMDVISAVGLKKHARHKPNQMSGGQQQRIGIARAFVGTPAIIFADEPTGNLDSRTSNEVMQLMLKMTKARNQTLIIVTHDNNIAKFADKVVYILDGRIEKVEEKTEDIRRYIHNEKKDS